MSQKDKLTIQLSKRKANGSFRVLKSANLNQVDFSSNDYLGLARSEPLKQQILNSYTSLPATNGSSGSRLLTGNSELALTCERNLSSIFGFDTTTLFGSGYMANLALFSTLPQRGDTILYDEFSHACIKDGCRLSLAKKLPFRHNDLEDLERKLTQTEGEVYIACESVYSMDGDVAPLSQIINIAEKFQAKVIVDEAHSTGLKGKGGSGFVSELGLQRDVFAVIYTFGKAMGIHGACIASNHMIKEFITNFSRPFIYTTAPSAFEIISIQEAFNYLEKHPSLSLNLEEKIERFNHLLPTFQSPSAIKSIVIGGNEKTKQAAEVLQQEGFDIRPILSPTVKEGSERLRICLHTFNTEQEIQLICQHLKNIGG